VPLFSCQRCGWATASSWRDAVQGHSEGCPGCSGSVELVPLAGRPQETIAALERVGTTFEMREATDLDGSVRLTLLGGLDIVVADRLTTRLQALRAGGHRVRIDLSELEFIDCTGFDAIIAELTAARRLGQDVEVERPVSAPVKRVITFMDVSAILWPPEPDATRPPLRVIEGARDSESERSDALPRPRQADGAHELALVVGESGIDRSRGPSDRSRGPSGSAKSGR
jgi:anti-anti-sigma factor